MLVTDKKRIARRYLQGWFLIDFVSTIPWGWLAVLVAGGGKDASSAGSARMAKVAKIAKLARFMRLTRMLKLLKLQSIWERLEAEVGSMATPCCKDERRLDQ